jgi:hypothetical protein
MNLGKLPTSHHGIHAELSSSVGFTELPCITWRNYKDSGPTNNFALTINWLQTLPSLPSLSIWLQLLKHESEHLQRLGISGAIPPRMQGYLCTKTIVVCLSHIHELQEHNIFFRTVVINTPEVY